MSLKKISLNGVDYVRADSVTIPEGDTKIVILQRGWVMVGIFSKKDQNCKLENASVIRSWGTSKGIGELVNGTLPDTKLDPCGTVEFHELTIIAMINCDGAKWNLK